MPTEIRVRGRDLRGVGAGGSGPASNRTYVITRPGGDGIERLSIFNV